MTFTPAQPLIAAEEISHASAAALAQTSQMRVRRHAGQVEVRPDGSSIETQHFELQVSGAALAAQLAQFPVFYSEGLTDLSIVEAYTLKSDGRRIPVDHD